MYDRAARVLTQPTTGTPADVGPGSYEPEKYGQKPFFKRGINFTFLLLIKICRRTMINSVNIVFFSFSASFFLLSDIL